MANRYCNIDGSQKVMDSYDEINSGFQGVQDEMDLKAAGDHTHSKNDIGLGNVPNLNTTDVVGGIIKTLGGNSIRIADPMTQAEFDLITPLDNVYYPIIG